jgi:cytoskeleton protein RodZ
VFEIGNSLREARLRQQLQFSVLEERTKVRPKYLRALEDEQFDLLPAPTYVKGFLKAYADALGLDGQLYVDEFNSRFVAGEEDAPFRTQRHASSRAARRVERLAVLVALVAIGLVTAVLVFGFIFPKKPTTKAWKHPVSTGAAAAPRASVHHLPRVTLVLRAARGDSILEVHDRSFAGKILFRGTLLAGKTQRFVGSRIWVSATAPANLDARLNGIAIPLVAHGSPATLVFGPHGQLTG